MGFKTKASKSVWPERVVGADPAAGALPTLVVPDDEVWEVEAVELTFVASADVANRDLQVIMKNSDGLEISSGPVDGTSITASQTVAYHLAQYGTVPADTSTNHYDQIAKEPKVILPPGSIITVTVALLEVLDNLTAISAMVNKYSMTQE